ncbi:hypothetical protein CK203_011740 [Vitis vinifera]|uniref:Uncharacterized protein n=1 Tax=Vitis vinifera TaxID=29760 RepID=A0A438JTZ3_VITVI|nr:hypothetical protein CK203_011740 [Vitis vinifera]
MMEGLLRATVEAIHSSPTQAVLYIPTHFASQQTAEEMALLAYNRALKLSNPAPLFGASAYPPPPLQENLEGSPVLGVGFTGSLASTRPKRGDHRGWGSELAVFAWLELGALEEQTESLKNEKPSFTCQQEHQTDFGHLQLPCQRVCELESKKRRFRVFVYSRRGSLGTTICNGYPSVIVLVRVLRASTSCANAGAKDQIQLIPFNAIKLSGPALGIGLAGKGF